MLLEKGSDTIVYCASNSLWLFLGDSKYTKIVWNIYHYVYLHKISHKNKSSLCRTFDQIKQINRKKFELFKVIEPRGSVKKNNLLCGIKE